MYLSFFDLKEMPFSLTPNTQFFCALEPHNEAMQVLLTALQMGEGFIKVTGEVGTGKTLLCRKLLNSLPKNIENMVTAYLPNSYLNPEELRWAFATELGLKLDEKLDQQALIQKIQHQLLELHQDGHTVVLIIDEAQCLSWDTLEALRLFTNLETESKKLLQVVLFGQPELDEKLANERVRQLRQRISFSYKLRPMNNSEVVHYIQHRLTIAKHDNVRSNNNDRLFSTQLALKIAKASRGIPRLVNLLCHKVLIQAFGEGEQKLNAKHVKAAINDTEDCKPNNNYNWLISITAGLSLFIAAIWLWRQVL
ncbi:ExeA family protein [Pseudoalteromonas denitrificans]|jgi:MSHA biogenesis protein MshM|uniref:MSHA biogenesis protein MshM n=1 Tax=Pseudoalteromonas denitrificans DSM 6059 TaxID=1123010 RepID=A0A1I1DWZ2_9GAMM|nr:AAA family ATPase [Pseudoalteromonas denitrificans]SFB77230.1 MSHA biogenesis protein MshM [Pseudoalteromonas denitrificans DSM 6059]